MIYERWWALTVLERVLSQLKDEYRAAGNAALFDSLKQLLPDEPGSPGAPVIEEQGVIVDGGSEYYSVTVSPLPVMI